MCGFLLNISDKGLTKRKIISVNQSLHKRGPDQNGNLTFKTFSGNKVDMIHTRLEISGLGKGGSQPMENERYIILFNGEIYNYIELSKLYGLEYKNGDTKVLLDLITKFGIERTLNLITGIFSIAILDKVNEILFLHRDIFATKPLYFYLKDKSLTVASNVESIGIVQDDKELGNLNELGETFFLLFGFTFISDKTTKRISELDPGNLYQIDLNSLKVKSKKIQFGCSDPNFIHDWEREIIDSYNADVPISILLSGGVDSTYLASLNNKAANKKIKTFTLCNKSGSNINDVSKAKEISKKLKLENSQIEVDNQKINIEVKSFIKNMEYPTDDGLNIYIATKSIFKNKFKVCLTGLGGDEFFSGYSSSKNGFLRLILRNSFLWRFIPFLKKIMFKKGYGGYLKFLRIDPSSIYGFLYSKAFIFESMSLKKVDQIIEIFAKSLKRNLPIDFYNNFNYFDRISFLEIHSYCIPQLVKDSDTFGMANSVEVRPSLLVKSLYQKLKENKLNKNRKLDGKEFLLKRLDQNISNSVNKNKEGFTIDINDFLISNIDEISKIIFSDKKNFKYKFLINEFREKFKKRKIINDRKKYFIWRLYILSLWKKNNKYNQ